ncbi:hypothetical protein [Pseudomonas mucidolens]|uniref:hypothetical protein n=1 Tax=Pseudomonas mucidolens TaxID=46679 RepID=UPI0030D7C28B
MKIWQAPAGFFLDAGSPISVFDKVARGVLETGYSPQEIHIPLWNEAFPALEENSP